MHRKQRARRYRESTSTSSAGFIHRKPADGAVGELRLAWGKLDQTQSARGVGGNHEGRSARVHERLELELAHLVRADEPAPRVGGIDVPGSARRSSRSSRATAGDDEAWSPGRRSARLRLVILPARLVDRDDRPQEDHFVHLRGVTWELRPGCRADASRSRDRGRMDNPVA